MTIKAIERDREIQIYGDIGADFFAERSVAAADILDALADMNGDPVTVRINSFGGSVADGLAIYNGLRGYAGDVTTRIEGYAYSIASLIAMAGDQIIMPKNALLMIHGPSTHNEGNAGDFRQTADVLDKHAQAMAGAYQRGGRVDADVVDQWLTDGIDHYFTAPEAAAVGLVDVVGESIAASVSPHQRIVAGATLSDLRREKTMDDQKNAILGERRRIQTIREACTLPITAGIREQADAIEAKAIAESWTVDQVHAALLKALPAAEPIAGDKAAPHVHSGQPAVSAGADHLDKLALGMTRAVEFRAGLARGKESGLVGENEYTGMSLTELARRNLEAHNIPVRGLNRDRIVAKALSVRADAGITHTTSDFPAVLENALNKAVLLGWTETEETWRQIARVGNLPDFRPAPRSGLGEYPTLPEVPEGGEFKYVTLSDRKETIVLLTYGSVLGITRQAIVNDDTSQFANIGMKQGRAAARRVGDLVYLVLTSNPTMQQDGKPLFDADHGNIATVVGAPSVTTLDNHRQLMALQKDNDQNAHGLNLPLQRLIVPVALQTVSQVLRESATNPDTVGDVTPNPFQQTFDVVADPRLDASSQVVWYTSTNPTTYDVIEAGFLEGATEPYLESRQGWTIDGLETKVRIDAAAIPLDFRTMVRNAGA